MFDNLQMAPPDPILGLTEAFRKDTTPGKINLGVGVYKDAQGNTPVLASVKEAERRTLQSENTKNYLPIDGSQPYAEAVQELLFGKQHETNKSKRAATAHTPGGTGALRVAGDFIKTARPGTTVWMSDPTWANHPKIFAAAGLATKTYPYFDAKNNVLDIDGMLRGLRAVPEGDAVLLHACCHNPTGVDPTRQQWKQIADVMAERKLLPLVDFAYQGFADGLTEDAAGLLELCRPGMEVLVCSSFSKNFGLYNERVGALTVIAKSAEQAQIAMSHVKAVIRANYSNPPSHGGSIITTVLNDATLRKQWEGEVQAMRDRINEMRGQFVRRLKECGVEKDFSFIARQKGMFSFSGLTKDQVLALRSKYAIYIVDSGRINVAGMTGENLGKLCEAIADVLGVPAGVK